MDDLRGISPFICTHLKYMEEGATPVNEYQRKMNPEVKQLLRKQLICLLDAGII